MTAEGSMGYDFYLLLCTLSSTSLLLYANYLIYFKNRKDALWIVYPAMIIHGSLLVMQGTLADEFQYSASTISLIHLLFAICLWGLAHLFCFMKWLQETKQ